PGYLIPFAPLAFASQRQKTSRTSLSPRAFLPISTHFTAPPEVPGPPTSLQTGRFGASSPVEPGAFNNRRPHPPTRALSPVIPPGIGQGYPFLPLDRSLQPEGLHPPRGVARSGLRPLPKILDCSLP